MVIVANEKILGVIKKYIKKPDTYFRVSHGKITDIKAEPINEEVSLNDTGEERFLELIEEAKENWDADYIIVELFRKANTKPQKKSFTQIKIKLSELQPAGTELSGFTEHFGGFQGIMEKTIKAVSLENTVTSLKAELQKTQSENEKLKVKNENFAEKNASYKDDIRELRWDLKETENQRKSDFVNNERQRKGMDRLLTLGGTVAANLAGIDSAKMRSLLRIEDEKQITEGEKAEQINTDNVDIEHEKHYEGKKLQARNIVDNINDWLINMLDNNDEDTALRIISSLYSVFTYAASDLENLKNINDLISEEQSADSSHQ